MSKGTIFIQPHSDDAVMSSYFLIKTEVLPRPYYLLTVFGQSNWIDPIKKRSHQYAQSKNQIAITHIRKTEDKKFAKSLGLTLLFFNLEDCLLRNGKVFYQPNKKINADLVKKVGVIIDASIKKYKAKNIVASFPSDIKQHYDHRVVCEAVKSLPLASYNRFFVDDIPYARITNYSKYNLHLFARSKIGDIYDKFRAMKIYDSQMCRLFLNQIQKMAKQNQGYERIFILNNK